jgi:hypothetical protein
MPDPYEIIGVRRDASLDEIRIAYRRSAQVLHPDRFATSSDGVRSEAARRMLQLNSAMEAIELERADEASGTGMLGSVQFGGGATASASAPPAAPPRTHTVPPPPSRTTPQPAASNGAPTPPPVRPVSFPPARIDPPRTVAPAPPPVEPEPVVDEAPAAEPPPVPNREVAAYVPAPAAEPEVSEPEAAPDPEFDPELAFERRVARPSAPPPPEPEQPRYALHDDRSFSFEDDDSEYDDLPPVSRRTRSRSGGRSPVTAIVAAVVIVIALAVIGAYFVLGRSSGSGEQTFSRAGAPFTFSYPKDFHQRRLDGGIALNKPTYQVGFGLDESNYLLASTYKLGFRVGADGSATGPKGQQLTPDQINHDIDVTIAKLAGQAGFTQKGVESGSLGSLRARIYDYAKPDGSLSSTFVVALSGSTEYYVTCQSSPQGETRIAKACDRLLSSFAPRSD